MKETFKCSNSRTCLWVSLFIMLLKFLHLTGIETVVIIYILCCVILGNGEFNSKTNSTYKKEFSSSQSCDVERSFSCNLTSCSNDNVKVNNPRKERRSLMKHIKQHFKTTSRAGCMPFFITASTTERLRLNQKYQFTPNLGQSYRYNSHNLRKTPKPHKGKFRKYFFPKTKNNSWHTENNSEIVINYIDTNNENTNQSISLIFETTLSKNIDQFFNISSNTKLTTGVSVSSTTPPYKTLKKTKMKITFKKGSNNLSDQQVSGAAKQTELEKTITTPSDQTLQLDQNREIKLAKPLFRNIFTFNKPVESKYNMSQIDDAITTLHNNLKFKPTDFKDQTHCAPITPKIINKGKKVSYNTSRIPMNNFSEKAKTLSPPEKLYSTTKKYVKIVSSKLKPTTFNYEFLNGTNLNISEGKWINGSHKSSMCFPSTKFQFKDLLHFWGPDSKASSEKHLTMIEASTEVVSSTNLLSSSSAGLVSSRHTQRTKEYKNLTNQSTPKNRIDGQYDESGFLPPDKEVGSSTASDKTYFNKKFNLSNLFNFMKPSLSTCAIKRKQKLKCENNIVNYNNREITNNSYYQTPSTPHLRGGNTEFSGLVSSQDKSSVIKQTRLSLSNITNKKVTNCNMSGFKIIKSKEESDASSLIQGGPNTLQSLQSTTDSEKSQDSYFSTTNDYSKRFWHFFKPNNMHPVTELADSELTNATTTLTPDEGTSLDTFLNMDNVSYHVNEGCSSHKDKLEATTCSNCETAQTKSLVRNILFRFHKSTTSEKKTTLCNDIFVNSTQTNQMKSALQNLSTIKVLEKFDQHSTELGKKESKSFRSEKKNSKNKEQPSTLNHIKESDASSYFQFETSSTTEHNYLTDGYSKKEMVDDSTKTYSHEWLFWNRNEDVDSYSTKSVCEKTNNIVATDEGNLFKWCRKTNPTPIPSSNSDNSNYSTELGGTDFSTDYEITLNSSYTKKRFKNLFNFKKTFDNTTQDNQTLYDSSTQPINCTKTVNYKYDDNINLNSVETDYSTMKVGTLLKNNISQADRNQTPTFSEKRKTIFTRLNPFKERRTKHINKTENNTESADGFDENFDSFIQNLTKKTNCTMILNSDYIDYLKSNKTHHNTLSKNQFNSPASTDATSINNTSFHYMAYLLEPLKKIISVFRGSSTTPNVTKVGDVNASDIKNGSFPHYLVPPNTAHVFLGLNDSRNASANHTKGPHDKQVVGMFDAIWGLGNCFTSSQKLKPQDIHFYLYTRNNSEEPEDILLYEEHTPECNSTEPAPNPVLEEESSTETNKKKRGSYDDYDFEPLNPAKSDFYSKWFNILSETKILIHGYLEDYRTDIMVSMKDAYLVKGAFNVIMVDWSYVGNNLCYVTEASKSAKAIGVVLAKLLDNLVEGGVDLTRVHIVGFSLGAHVAGHAGSVLKYGLVSRITGLDPALPYMPMEAEASLDLGDAMFVDVIHSAAGYLGQPGPSGHVDFYPNGGSQQPGCNISSFAQCSHRRSVQYFTESINSELEFRGTLCDSWHDYKAGHCDNGATLLMGDVCPYYGSGKYFLLTGDREPFAQLPEGHVKVKKSLLLDLLYDVD